MDVLLQGILRLHWDTRFQVHRGGQDASGKVNFNVVWLIDMMSDVEGEV